MGMRELAWTISFFGRKSSWTIGPFILFFSPKKRVNARTNLRAYLPNSISTSYLEKKKKTLVTYFFSPFLNLIHLQFYGKQITNYIFLIYIENSPENFNQYVYKQ